MKISRATAFSYNTSNMIKHRMTLEQCLYDGSQSSVSEVK